MRPDLEVYGKIVELEAWECANGMECESSDSSPCLQQRKTPGLCALLRSCRVRQRRMHPRREKELRVATASNARDAVLIRASRAVTGFVSIEAART